MIITHTVTIPQLSDEHRRMYIYLPQCLKEDPHMRCPVLYMFDGHNVFFDSHATYGKSWGLGKYLDKTGIPLIVAAIECSHDPKHGRIKEYAPLSFYDEGFGRITGKGRITMEWFVNEFKPFVDAHYPTLPDREHTFIGGSSMGGLMSLYAVTRYNRVFSRAAALSPSLWTEDEKLDRLLSTPRLGKNTVIYMDYGTKEMDYRPDMAERLGQVSTLLARRGAAVTLRLIPGGTHCEASWERQIPHFMSTLLCEEE